MMESATSEVLNESSPAFLQIVSLLEGRLANPAPNGRVVGVTACTRGAGASYATRLLARDLARTGKRVLLADARSFLEACRRKGPDLQELCLFDEEAQMWRLPKMERSRPAWGASEPSLEQKLEPLWREMDCVLLDLGTVTAFAGLQYLAPVFDDLFLVVAAGESTRAQIAYAQKLLAHCGGRLTGCILNKRTYPLPQRVFRALYG